MSAPAGWMASGRAPSDYEFSTDLVERHSGTKSAVIRSRTDKPSGFATLMQQIVADDHRGHRVRLSGWVKTDGMTGWCGLWMRIDGDDDRQLGFDNMVDRPITGSQPWARHEVVLDVPQASAVIAFGLLITGPGTAWLDDVLLERVGPDVPTTNSARQWSRVPQNLSFED